MKGEQLNPISAAPGNGRPIVPLEHGLPPDRSVLIVVPYALDGASGPFQYRRPLPGNYEMYVRPDAMGGRKFDAQKAEIADALEYINSRLESFLIRPEVRNVALLEDPVIKALGITTVEGISRHMMNTGKRYIDADGNDYLPHTAIQPNKAHFKNKRFNWDTEDHLELVLNSNRADRLSIARGEIWNSIHIMNANGGVTNAAGEGHDDRLHPPLHTRMIRKVDNATPENERNTQGYQEWHEAAMDFALREYGLWNIDYNKQRRDKFNHNVPGYTLAKYGSKDMGYDLIAELESGWDFTDRFYGRCGDFLPTDLNYYLVETERHLIEDLTNRGEYDMAGNLTRTNRTRKAEMMKHNYNPEKNWFFDYDYKHGEQSEVEALSGFLPYGILEDRDQKAGMLGKLANDFLKPYGLILARDETLPKLPADGVQQLARGMQRTVEKAHRPKQWSGDNQFLKIADQVCDVLEAEQDEALRPIAMQLSTAIMENAVIGLTEYFKKTGGSTSGGKMPEKLNAVTGEMGNGAVYGDQEELAMTFGVFTKFVKKLEQRTDRVIDSESNGREPDGAYRTTIYEATTLGPVVLS